jgi:CarD family transcriptional regulator
MDMAKRFKVGDKVVYPHHGAAVIESVSDREFEGGLRSYWVLKLSYGDLTLMVPTDGAADVGLRSVISKKELTEVYKVLRSKTAVSTATNWSRRFKNNVEKLRSGDIFQVAEVVRSLSSRDIDKGLSAGEKRMLSKARQILISEISFASGEEQLKVQSKLDEMLGVDPSDEYEIVL